MEWIIDIIVMNPNHTILTIPIIVMDHQMRGITMRNQHLTATRITITSQENIHHIKKINQNTHHLVEKIVTNQKKIMTVVL